MPVERPISASSLGRHHVEQQFTSVQLDEFRKFGEDLVRARYDIVFFAERFLGMQLHDGQKKFLRKKAADIINGRSIKVWILVPANRYGKSVLVAVLHIWHNFFKIGLGAGNPDALAKAGYMTANLAPHSDATKPVFEAVLAILRSAFVYTNNNGEVVTNNCLIGWLLDEAHIRTSTPYMIPFTNNTQILFRSTGEDKGDSIQGKNFGYISYDEGGRSNHLEYELDANIIPRLADLNGSLDIVSTPDMRSSSLLYHYDLFEKGKNGEYGYYSQEGDIADNVFLLRNNPTYIEDEERRLAGNPIADQVLRGKFVFAGDTFYPADDILHAKDPSLDGGIPYEDGHQYVVSVDPASGGDDMVYDVLDVTARPFRLVRQVVAKGNSKSPEVHMADFEALVRGYLRMNNLKIALETWNGDAGSFYKSMPYDLQMLTFCWGSWQPDAIPSKEKARRRNIRKPEILLALRQLLYKQEIKLPNDPKLVKQLSIYREDDENLKQDCVMTLALASWKATDGAQKVINEVYELDI